MSNFLCLLKLLPDSFLLPNLYTNNSNLIRTFWCHLLKRNSTKDIIRSKECSLSSTSWASTPPSSFQFRMSRHCHWAYYASKVTWKDLSLEWRVTLLSNRAGGPPSSPCMRWRRRLPQLLSRVLEVRLVWVCWLSSCCLFCHWCDCIPMSL